MDILALRWGYTRDHSEGGLVWCELGDPDHRAAPEHVARLLWPR